MPALSAGARGWVGIGLVGLRLAASPEPGPSCSPGARAVPFACRVGGSRAGAAGAIGLLACWHVGITGGGGVPRA